MERASKAVYIAFISNAVYMAGLRWEAQHAQAANNKTSDASGAGEEDQLVIDPDRKAKQGFVCVQVWS